MGLLLLPWRVEWLLGALFGESKCATLLHRLGDAIRTKCQFLEELNNIQVAAQDPFELFHAP